MKETLLEKLVRHAFIENKARFYKSILEKNISSEEVEDLYIQHVEATIEDVNKNKVLPFQDIEDLHQLEDTYKEAFLVNMSKIAPLFLEKMGETLTKIREKRRIKTQTKLELLQLQKELSSHISDLTEKYKGYAEEGDSRLEPIVKSIKKAIINSCKTLNYLLLEEKSLYPKKDLAEIQSFWAVRADMQRVQSPEDFIFGEKISHEIGRNN